MPVVVVRKGGEAFRGEVADNTNLVVRAGIKKFPFPNLAYGCGMGKCGKCACLVLSGGEHLGKPNWKEERQLGPRIAQGWRLACQLWLRHDIEITQDQSKTEAESCTSS